MLYDFRSKSLDNTNCSSSERWSVANLTGRRRRLSPMLAGRVPLTGQQVPQVNPQVNDLIARCTSRYGFFAKANWRASSPFVVPGEGYWVDTHRIERLRTSTFEDFDVATPMPMPVYIERNPWAKYKTKLIYLDESRRYRLCRKVAVSSDGKIYRATDAEIEAALQTAKNAPSTDAATYVKTVQEVRRRHKIATPV